MGLASVQELDRRITVVDDFGKNHLFDVIDHFEYAGMSYVIAKPVNDDSEDGKGLILQVNRHGEEIVYLCIADDEKWKQVFKYACESSIIWEKEVVRGYHGLGVRFSLWKQLVKTFEKSGYGIAFFIFLVGRFLMNSKSASHILEIIYMPFLLFAFLAMCIWIKKRYFNKKGGRKK